ncbi:MAG: YceD family protein [Rhodoferax sp.]|nr:YceD family protein [Rhodoferax sp.]
MKTEFVARRLDVKAFAQAAGQLAAQDTLGKYGRLMQETQGLGADLPLNWTATGELRPTLGEPDQVWLHLQAEATLPLTCQRCLGPVDVHVSVDRTFRFVADEETAAAQDDESEEDLLVLSHDFDLHALIEDEVLMELPHLPRHEVCPVDVKLAVADEAFEAETEAKPNPFAILAKLKGDKAS